MSFNVGSFITSQGKSIADRAVSEAGTRLDGALGGVGGLGSLALGVLSSGASLQTIKSIASLKIDSFLSGKVDDFFSSIRRGKLGGLPRVPTSFEDLFALNKTGKPTAQHYPPDLTDFCVTLQFSAYSRPNVLSKAESVITHYISLPLPRDLVSMQSTDYNTVNTGAFGTAADAIGNAASGNGTLKGSGTDLAVMGGLLAAKNPMVQGMLAMVPAEAITLFEQYTGAVLNPNLSVAFQSPSLRDYNLNWDFAPESAAESKTIQEIIESIKQRSLPSFGVEGSSAILSYPEMVKVKVLPDKGENSIGRLMKFKRAVITGVTASYSPSGIPSFFAGTDAPTFITLSVSFKEIEYMLSRDWGGPESRGVGNELLNLGETLKDSLFANFGGEPQAPGEK